MSRNVLMVDNHDSFTFNIVEALERLGAKVRTVRNEIAATDAFERAREDQALILLSPGPGRPESPRYKAPPAGSPPGTPRCYR